MDRVTMYESVSEAVADVKTVARMLLIGAFQAEEDHEPEHAEIFTLMDDILRGAAAYLEKHAVDADETVAQQSERKKQVK